MNLTITLGLSTLALSVAVWHCWKSNKPLREKARKEAEAAAESKRREEAAGREKDRRNNLQKEVFEDLSVLMQDPDRVLRRDRIHTHSNDPAHYYRFPVLWKFITKVNNLKDQSDRIASLEDRLFKQSNLIRDMQLQQREVQKVLQMGQPVEM